MTKSFFTSFSDINMVMGNQNKIDKRLSLYDNF